MMANFNHFPEITAKLHKAMAEIVTKAAFDVEAQAKPLAAVATGFMRSTIYVLTKDSSTYGQGVSGSGEMLPELEAPADDQTAWIGVGAAYGEFQELGTRNMAPHPFMAPAAELVEPSFLQAAQAIERMLGGN